MGELSLNWLLAGVAVAQWATYALTLVSFVRRELLNGSSVVFVKGFHAGAALATYGVALACTYALGGAPVAVQILGLAVAAIALCAALVASRSWFPAGRVLSRRLDQNTLATTRWRLLYPRAWTR